MLSLFRKTPAAPAPDAPASAAPSAAPASASASAGGVIYLGRQAIFDTALDVTAYELLYRDGSQNAAAVSDDDAATRTVLTRALTEFGLDTVSDGRDVFVNFSPESLRAEFADLLPRERTVIEVLETVQPDEPTIADFRRLKDEGCRLALDDVVFEPRLAPLLDLADIVKVDLRLTDPADLASHVEQMRRHGVQLLAEKVESQDELDRCRELGFDLFQGWFFCKPTVLEGRTLETDRVGTLRLIARLQDPALEMGEAAELISQDPGLSMKLLKFINSSACGLGTKVESIKHAAALVGRHKLKLWATLLGLGGMSDKPRELLIAANVRGRMCERIGASVFGDESGAYFTVGMFSLLDAMLDMPMQDLIGDLPLSETVVEGLLHGRGDLGRVLDAVKSWEREQAGGESFDEALLCSSYKDALCWTRETLATLGA